MSGDDWNVLSWHRDLAAAMRAQNFPLALQLANKILVAQPNNLLAQEIAKVLKEKEDLAKESSSDEDDGADGENGAENGDAGTGEEEDEDDDDDDEGSDEETDGEQDTDDSDEAGADA